MYLYMILTILMTFCCLTETEKMKGESKSPVRVAVTAQGPEISSKISPRFGQARYLLEFDLNSELTKVVERVTPAHGSGTGLANLLINSHIDVVITGKIGPKSLKTLKKAKVRVIEGVSGTVGNALNRFKSDELDFSRLR